MRRFFAGVISMIVIAAAVGLAGYFFLLPRLDWGADQAPPRYETRLVFPVLDRWIERNASAGANPLAATPENLKEARDEYNEHCAACHGQDGSGHNDFGADFYPPVAKLTGDTQKLTDGQLYWIVAKGFASTGMPAFGKEHSPEDIWRMVLWVRHLPPASAGGK
jgi:mono/diheme cytochrome c family protein